MNRDRQQELAAIEKLKKTVIIYYQHLAPSCFWHPRARPPQWCMGKMGRSCPWSQSTPPSSLPAGSLPGTVLRPCYSIRIYICLNFWLQTRITFNRDRVYNLLCHTKEIYGCFESISASVLYKSSSPTRIVPTATVLPPPGPKRTPHPPIGAVAVACAGKLTVCCCVCSIGSSVWYYFCYYYYYLYIDLIPRVLQFNISPLVAPLLLIRADTGIRGHTRPLVSACARRSLIQMRVFFILIPGCIII